MYAAEQTDMRTERDFGDLYNTYGGRVRSLCRYLLNSVDAAEDATHEVFLRAHRAIETYNPALSFSSWILGIANHYCVDILRRRTLESRLFAAPEQPTAEPTARTYSALTGLIVAERAAEVRSAVSKLPDKYRVPLVMAYYSEWSYDQIADALNLDRNHVATLIFRAKQQLRELLAGHGAKGARK
jgi:RNA polymerase sigma-70 factor (ECF subfamily)